MESTSDAQSVEQIKQNWRVRIIAECGKMHQAIENLRELAVTFDDHEFVECVGQLHEIYCQMANTITLRMLLNGAIEALGCEKHDDTIGTGRESTS